MIEKLISFNESLNEYINSGQADVTDQVFFRRMKICTDCEFYKKTLSRCDKCGCFLHIKARWATEKCPIDKWSSEIAADQSQEPSSFQIQNSSEKSGGCGCGK